MPSSQGSIQSKKSGTSYKKVSNGSQVDESLFGSKKQPSSKPGSQARKSVKISDAEVTKIKTQVKTGTIPENATVIPLSEIQRMKAAAVLKTKDQLIAESTVLEEQKEQQRAAAKARKERMQELEKERQRNAPMTEAEREDAEKKKKIREKAGELLDREHDDVKHMNQMVLYSKIVTVRDEQLKEKKVIEEEKKQTEEQLDLMMEIERLKVIKYHDEREQKWKEDRIQGARVLEEQIKERDFIRMKEQEMLEKERAQMLRQIEALQEEENRLAQEKMVTQKKLLGEVEQANNKAILIKEARKRQEIEEDERIMKYNLDKAKREQELIEDQLRIKAEKEREVQRLRERQERAKDRQSELDALRAKRAQEAQERIEREKEYQEAQKLAKINAEIEEARINQAQEREIRMLIQAKQERDEFERIIQAQKEAADKERMIEEQKAMIRKQHAEQLKAQILTNDEKKSQDQREYLEEGRKLRNEIEDEKRKLERIKHEKLEGLKKEGVPEKYTAELARKKITI